MNADPYRDFLEKEITLMGTLSAFCTLAVAAVLTATPSGTLFGSSQGGWGLRVLVMMGSLCTLFASLALYLQRSKYAQHYGKIALAQSKNDEPEVTRLLNITSDESVRIRYHVAFGLLTAGFFDYAIAILCTSMGWLDDHVHKYASDASIQDGKAQFVIAAITLVAGVLYGVTLNHVLTQSCKEPGLWRAARRSFKRTSQ